MKIGEVGRYLGLQAHVLRHWDDVGVVVPERTSSGRRDYSHEDLHRLRVLRACQEVGLSLPEIRQVLHRGEPGRVAVIEHHLARIRAQQARFEATEQFLVHVLTCRHDLLTRCERCTSYAGSLAEEPAPSKQPSPASGT